METAKPKTEADFLKLFLRHENALRAYARSLLPHWDAVDDVLQDASIVMWQKIDQIETPGGFLPWAKVILRFHCLRYCDKKRANSAVFSGELIALLADEAERIVEDEYIKRRRALEACMSNLTQPERELVLAPYVYYGRIKEIAADNGVSSNALYKKLGRLRDRLRNCMEKRLA